MITSWLSPDGSTARIQARGNFSLDAAGLLSLLIALAVVTLFLAGLLAWQGYWPVLLIAVIQVVLVTWILVRTWQRAWLVETIQIGPNRIRVVQQRHTSKRKYELETAWAKVEVKRPGIAWYGPRVVLKSKSTELEVGGFLTGDEKHQLAEQLKSAIEKHSVL